MSLDQDACEEVSAPLPDAARHVLHVHRNADVWTWAIAIAIAAELRRHLQAHPRTRLLLSGGRTPVPVYRALSMAPLPWDRIDVGLVDERWLLPEDPDSHAHQVRESLLHDHAAGVRFEVITRAGRSLEDAIAAANAHAQQPASVAVLGMGTDGHVASWYPGMADLDRALRSRQAYTAVDAGGIPIAGAWDRRITITPAGLARVHTRLLLIRGADKRAAFERALESGDPYRWPVLAARDAGTAPLQVHWCA